jgi:ribosomal protein S6--L-glutamate ligase
VPHEPEQPEAGASEAADEDGRILVGWREWVSLPAFGIAAIKAKADTGARTCALHAEALQRHTLNGTPMIGFRVFPFRGDRVTSVTVEAELVDERLVRSSDGDAQIRPFVRTVLEIAGLAREVDLSLARRELMGFRMLLGRVALTGMLVDPMRSYVWGDHEPPPRPSRSPPPLRED